MTEPRKVLTPGSPDVEELRASSTAARLASVVKALQNVGVVEEVTMSADPSKYSGGFNLKFSEREASSRCTWGSKPDGGPRL